MVHKHSKYDNMQKNGMFYALICTNNQIISYYNFMISIITKETLYQRHLGNFFPSYLNGCTLLASILPLEINIFKNINLFLPNFPQYIISYNLYFYVIEFYDYKGNQIAFL